MRAATVKEDVGARYVSTSEILDEKGSWRRPARFSRTLFARTYDDGTASIKATGSRALIGPQPDTFLVHPCGRGDGDRVLVD